MSEALGNAREAIARGTRILVNEDAMDAFGHVSMRNPEDPNQYLLSYACAPNLIEPADILEFTLESEPSRPTDLPLFAERVIHGEVYKARPDVLAVVHYHPAPILLFCITSTQLVPVFLSGATIGRVVPFWDQRDEFGDTNLLVVKPEEGRSLARALGPHSIILMKRHGATAVASSVQELVFRAVYACRNAEAQSLSKALGSVAPLSDGEIERAGRLCARQHFTSRTWEFWSKRLIQSGSDLDPLSAEGLASAGIQ